MNTEIKKKFKNLINGPHSTAFFEIMEILTS